jgi:hypothetical protein
MTFLRVLHAEALKMRRTIAWKMAILAPGIVVLLAFFAAWKRRSRPSTVSAPVTNGRR